MSDTPRVDPAVFDSGEVVAACLARDLERDLNNALDALRQLHDEQNGAPLETRRKEWEAAMAYARTILTLHNR